MRDDTWMFTIDWKQLVATLNNLDPNREYELREGNTVWSRAPRVLVGVEHNWSAVLDPVRNLIQLKANAAKYVQAANEIVHNAVKHGYKEDGSTI